MRNYHKTKHEKELKDEALKIEIHVNMNTKDETDSDDKVSYNTDVGNKRKHEMSNANFWYTSHETGRFQDLYGPYFDINHLRKSFFISFFFLIIISHVKPYPSFYNEHHLNRSNCSSLAYYFKMWHSQLPIGYCGYMHDLASIYTSWSRASTHNYSALVFSFIF